jgi:periplasmic protein TonB
MAEERRFHLALVLMFVVFLPPALLIPSLNLPEPDRRESEKTPPQLAHLIEEKKPPEPVIAPKPEPEPEKKKQKPVEEKSVEVAKAPEPPKPEPKPEPAPKKQAPAQTVEKAREKATRSGLLAMKDTLASMRGPEPVTKKTLSANTGSGQPGPQKSSDIAEKALAGSGGVEVERGITRNVAVADHQVRDVEVAEEKVAAPAEPKQRVAHAGPSTRSMKNIRKVFDANKAALNAMVGREQRKDPLLHGKVLLKLVIEPDGSVSSCKVIDSELDNPKLEQRIALRVRMFNFGDADVEQRELNFPLDFLPG